MTLSRSFALLCMAILTVSGCEQRSENDRTEYKDSAGNPRVQLETSLGDITLELYEDKAPLTTANFLAYVQESFYDGTQFHRVIPDFVIQGGGFTEKMEQKSTRVPIHNESDNGLPNRHGSISMARTADPHSATSQFFISLKDNDNLNPQGGRPGYAVFGQVVAGMSVVDEIARQPTGNFQAFQDVPKKPILIRRATVLPSADK